MHTRRYLTWTFHTKYMYAYKFKIVLKTNYTTILFENFLISFREYVHIMFVGRDVISFCSLVNSHNFETFSVFALTDTYVVYILEYLKANKIGHFFTMT